MGAQRCDSRPDYNRPGCFCECGCISGEHDIHSCIYENCDNRWYDDGSEVW